MRWIDPAGLRRLHILTDCVLVSIGWIAAWGLRYALNEAAGYPINTLGNYLRALPLVVLPWVFTGWLFGLYRVQRMNTAVDELQSLFRSAALGALVVASIGFFFRELEIGRFVVLAIGGLQPRDSRPSSRVAVPPHRAAPAHRSGAARRADR